MGNDENIKFVKSNFGLHVFRKQIGDETIVYQVIKMKDCVFICINNVKNMTLSNLSLATLSRYEKLPIGTCLMGNFTEEKSKIMAVRVAKKLNKTSYVSCSVEDKMTSPIVEKYLYEEIRAKPEKF